MPGSTIEPTSKQDSARVLEETGIESASYATLKRRLAVYGTDAWRRSLSRSAAAYAGLGPASLVLYDVLTLYFETDEGDGFREPGFSKERRLETQITIGLLTDASGFPLMVDAFEGNKAETQTMLPVIRAFKTAYRLNDVTVVADAGMISEANRRAIEAEGLSFILGMKIPDVPYCRRRVAARPYAPSGTAGPARPGSPNPAASTGTRSPAGRADPTPASHPH
jgi:hypothetical protein